MLKDLAHDSLQNDDQFYCGFLSFRRPDMGEHDVELANDLLRGAAEIAEFLGFKSRRAIFHLYKTSKYFPAFKIGSMICARKSALMKWIEDGEKHVPRNHTFV